LPVAWLTQLDNVAADAVLTSLLLFSVKGLPAADRRGDAQTDRRCTLIRFDALFRIRADTSRRAVERTSLPFLSRTRMSLSDVRFWMLQVTPAVAI
jgi:hypothetical protein